MLNYSDFFKESEMRDALFAGTEHLWDALKQLSNCISNRLRPNVSTLSRSGSVVVETTTLENGAVIHEGAFLNGEDIEIGAGSVVEPSAYINGPAIIGPDTEVRHGAYIRGNVFTGADCVIGHCTEVKHSALLGGSAAGHFAYIGDSILGAVNLGAGTKLGNFKIVDSNVVARVEGQRFQTGLRKFGVIMGDGCQTGCNSTTAPGTIMSKNVLLYPNVNASGYYSSGSIVKLRQKVEILDRERR